MVINDTVTETSNSKTLGGCESTATETTDEKNQINNIVRKEASYFGKDNYECQLSCLTREEIKLRLTVLDEEMENELTGLTMRFSKNKEKILSALMVKKKNCHSHIF